MTHHEHRVPDLATLVLDRSHTQRSAVAVTDGTLEVTFAEFADRAARLAGHLRDLGVGPEVRVGVLLDRSLDQLVSLTAVLLAGGVYIPLDPSYPSARITYILEDARAQVVIGRHGSLERVDVGATVRAVRVDQDAETIARVSPYRPGPVNPDHLAYIVYTSGSTGRPKGAMNTRAALASHLHWMQQHYPLGPGDVVLQKTPVGFDVSISECLWGLGAGAHTVVAGAGAHRDPDLLARLVRRHGVTAAHFVPSMFSVFLDTADLSGCGTLRHVVLIGEAVTAPLVRRFLGSGLSAQLHNLYGPAEAAIAVTRWPCLTDADGPSVPIGTAAPRTDIHVLDDRQQPVPAGDEGELYIGGTHVGRGYHDRAALTAERFLPDPFSGVGGARLYRTGDRARVRPDGVLEFLGRVDHQVKLRGVRIELSEIEAVLAGAPGVRDAAVVMHGNGEAARLVAYVAGAVSEPGLREQVAEVLPETMIPAAFVVMDELPLSPNGKLDRAALAALEPTPAPTGQAGPRGATEHAVAAAWEQVLGIEGIGRDSEFTAVGGTSLHAVRVVSRLRAEHGSALGIGEFFEAGTVARIAALLERSEKTHTVLPHRADAPLLPSGGQRRLWFLDHLHHTAGVSYNIPVVTRIRGPLDVEALRSALDDVLTRHEQLGMALPFTDGDLRAVTTTGVLDLEVLSVDGNPLEAATLIAERSRTHLDLSHGPLVRASLLRLGTHEHVLVLVLHHVVADGWTVDILDRDLALAYSARVAGRRPLFAENTHTYRDFVQWSRDREEDLGPWRAQLSGAPVVLDLPTDRPRPAVRAHRGARVVTRAAGVLADVVAVATATRTTPYAVCAAALGLFLRELTGAGDLLVASPTAGRPDPGLEEVAGYFANTVPIRLRPGSGTFTQITADVHRSVLEALEHQYVPFESLVREFAPAGDLSRSPLTQVAVAYQGPRRPYAMLTGLELEPLASDTGTAKFDLTFEIHESGDDLELSLEYDSDLFTSGRAREMLQRYAAVLAEQTGEDAPAPGTHEPCLHEVFTQVARQFPHRVAVVDKHRSLSYAELDRASNELAQRLVACGAGPEHLVGLCTERGVDLVVAVLGVLKSGAAYVPLDPGHPAARSRYVLDDADCRLVVADAENAETLTAPGRTVVTISGQGPLVGSERGPQVGVRSGHAAYVIYTSGSTGRPKGVVVPHANVLRLFAAASADYRFGPDDVWTLFHSAAFDFSVWELWGPLLHGGRLVVVDHVTSRDPGAFLDVLRARQVTVLSQTPTAFRHLTAAAEDAGFPPLDLRLVVFGGETLEPSALRTWVKGYGMDRPRLFNMYGITETTVHVTIRELGPTDLDAAVSPIGRPLDGVRVHLLDPEMHEVPAGVEGEIYVAGTGVARGYLGRPALTAQRFVPDPFGAPGERLYRTGDLAVRLEGSGELAFRGRSDSQVQLHGFRIELGEVERALLDQPGVRAAVCLLSQEAPHEPRLVAFVVTQRPPEVRQLRAELAKILPTHMLPSEIVWCEALPLTVNGKLDREALLTRRTVARSSRPGENPGDQPRSDAEHTLARIWAQELNVEAPAVDDNFFAVGGDSIRAIRVGIAAREAGLPVTVERLFLHPTIRELAQECARLGAQQEQESVSDTVLPPATPALPEGVVDAYPTASMQLGILYECELADDRPELYHDLASVRLSGRFDRGALRRALDAMSDNHELLRTSFALAQFDVPMQLVHSSARIPLEVDQLSGHDATAEAQAWWQKELSRAFDFALPPLVRCHVLVESPQHHRLSLALHHIVLDGWSLAQLMTELLQAYDTALGSGSAALGGAPAARYRDFVAAEQAAINSVPARAFWQDQVGRLPDPELPVLPTEPFGGTGDLPGALDENIRQAAARIGTPQKSVYLAAHLWALAQLTGRSKAASGVQMNGRLDEAGSDRLLGVLLNVPPLLTEVSGRTWAELARQAFEAERTAQPHRRFPLGQIRRLAQRPLFMVAFNFIDFHNLDRTRDLTHLDVVDWWFADQHSFPLRVEFSRSPETGARVLHVSTGVNADHLSGTARHLDRLIREALRLIAQDEHATCPDPQKADSQLVERPAVT
ncbi:amino acid adenylation domain-containing protein [Kineosporia sp. J2-2]|uniref:Amino acid adenylation domain-containing protein n=1 Tax=Kineosporia corallincola TaxID=2835133 RepID=A0ABS5TPF3_9ACTN|nr:non-ribosomal peptide synthetase [Kineosporia corallincola]MBT0772981.1 amino acid adenylation domain-containing protein [Kineosporia corallincola]